MKDAQLATGTLFASPGRTAGQDTGAIPGNSQFPGIPEQTLSGSRFYPNFGKDLLHEPLWTILEGSALGSQVSEFLDDAWSPYWLLLVFTVFLSGFAMEGM